MLTDANWHLLTLTDTYWHLLTLIDTYRHLQTCTNNEYSWNDVNIALIAEFTKVPDRNYKKAKPISARMLRALKKQIENLWLESVLVQKEL